MYQIQKITSDAKQKQTLVLPDGTQIKLIMYYIPLQTGWFIKELTYGTFTIKGVRISNSQNLLYQYRNQLPFGLACLSALTREPTQQKDFSTGSFKLYIATAAEVTAYAESLSG